MPREKDVQTRVARFYASCGCHVYSTSQYRASRMAIGIPDLYVVHPRIGGFWHEVKRPGGKQSDGQHLFQVEVEAAGVGYVLGGIDEAQAFLTARGLLLEGKVAQMARAP